MSDSPAVVIDNGSGMIKAGIAGQDAPTAYFPTVIGIPRFAKLHGSDEKDFFIGHDAINKKGVLNLQYPLENGIVSNWEHMTKIWYHTYYTELKIDPSEQPVLMTEAPLNPKANREKMMEIFFEEFKVPGFYVFTQAVLALYSSGRTTGAVLDSGDGVTHIVVVYDGYSIKHATGRMDVAGRDLTNFLQKHLAEDGYNLKTTSDREIAKAIKEKLCYVPLDFESESKAFDNPDKKVEYELPDGTKIKIGSLLIKTPECLFKPQLLGLDIPGVHEFIKTCVQKSDLDIRRELYSNITLSGGTTMFEGLQERLNKELSAIVPNSVKVKIVAPVERKFSIWLGGSVLSILPTFQTSWITPTEFADVGPSIVHRRCF